MLHVIYRSYGPENSKCRPPFYSKLLALQSMVRAAKALGHEAEILYLNDGPIPSDRLTWMEATGEVIARNQLGNKQSVRVALAIPEQRSWAHDDLVWLAEDDHLYLPSSLSALVEASRVFSEASYFGLYASHGRRAPWGASVPAWAAVPATWRDGEPQLVHGHPWRKALSTCCTFGARVGALLADRTLFRVALWSGGTWDQTMCLLYQGLQPLPMSMVMEPLREGSLSRRLRGIGVSAIRGGLDVFQALRMRSGGVARTLVAPEPSLTTHMESGYLAVGTDWPAAANECRRWAEDFRYGNDSHVLSGASTSLDSRSAASAAES